jgi:hypothetical protein
MSTLTHEQIGELAATGQFQVLFENNVHPSTVNLLSKKEVVTQYADYYFKNNGNKL